MELERLMSRDRGFEPRARSVTRARNALGTRLTRVRLALADPYPHPKTVEPYFIGVLGSDQDSQPCEPYPHGAKGPCTPSAPAAWQGPINQLVVIQRNRVLNNGGVVVRGVRACESNPARLHTLDPGSHSRPACVATQHTANVLVEANVVLNSSVQRVHVNRTHASHVLVAEGAEPSRVD